MTSKTNKKFYSEMLFLMRISFHFDLILFQLFCSIFFHIFLQKLGSDINGYSSSIINPLSTVKTTSLIFNIPSLIFNSYPLSISIIRLFSPSYKHCFMKIYTNCDPQYYHQTFTFLHWHKEMKDKLYDITSNNTQ